MFINETCSKNYGRKNKNTSFNNSKFKIINNVTANEETDASTFKKLLVDQICSSVKWRETLIYMSKKGIRNFIEIGPGKVLSGMVKRTIKDENLNCFSINSIADMKILENEFKK